MTPERYQRIDRILQAALELAPERWPAFLDEACSGDATLRCEVESLLTSDGQSLSFIDEPAVGLAARLLASAEPELAPGTQIDRYEVVYLLGRGGMGEVYLAHDNKLDRKVALKLLPLDYTTDQERLHRFQQEARAASALNHPNIITIYEIGQVDNRHFIATEFIDGQTLRQRLKEPLTVPDALGVANQICGALSAAHQAGIVHRDIKPENIMLRHDGYVKVLDFGLAKLTEEAQRSIDLERDESRAVSSGLVMGTIKYMSPEQAQGFPVDHRSDLFSLGVVLYEMLTGRAPFEGDNGRELVRSILADQPPPVTDCLADAPEELQGIVSKLLSKEKAERYQSSGELLLDLEHLQTERTSIVAQLRRQIQEHKLRAAMVLAALVVVVIGISFGLYKFLRPGKAPFQNVAITKLTNFGDAWNPALSPDGKFVVYAKGWGSEGPGKFSLWRKDVGSPSEVQIVPPTEIDGFYGGTNFSPDGEYVHYWVRLKNQPIAMYAVPVSGGAPKKVPLRKVPVGFSPDNKRIAYLDNRISAGKTVLVVANADGTDERDIITRQAPNYYRTALNPRWSPDGRLILCIGQNGNESFGRVFEIDIATGTERPITNQKWTGIRGFVWLPDMSGLLLAAAEETSSIYQIWHISYPGGDARRVTNDTVSYWSVDVTADGKTVVAQKVEAPTSFWVLPVEARQLSTAGGSLLTYSTGNARQINSATISSGENDGLAWTPEGRIIYVSEEAGNADLWSMNAEGGDRKQLTTDPHRDAAPDVSSDGRYITFVSTRADAENIWIMDADGSNQRRLTTKLIERHPVFSADNKWVYFVSWQTGKGTIWRISVDGGEPTQVISDVSFAPTISPDGKFLAYTSPPGKVFIVPAEGGLPINSFDARGGNYRWAPDGQTLTFTCVRCKADRSNWPDIWAQPLDGGAPHQLTNFTMNYVFLFAWSRDGKQLAVASHTLPSDIVLITDIR